MYEHMAMQPLGIYALCIHSVHFEFLTSGDTTQLFQCYIEGRCAYIFIALIAFRNTAIKLPTLGNNPYPEVFMHIVY